jgi:adenylate cyclase
MEGQRDRPAIFLAWLYRKLGRFYPAAFLIVEAQNALVVTAATLGLLTFYYEGSFDEFLLIAAIVLGLTQLSICISLLRSLPRLRPIRAWIGGQRDPEQTARAWGAAVGLPLELIRRDLPLPALLAVLPGSAAAVVVLDLAWYDFFALVAASLVAVGYAAILHYLAMEGGMRPVLRDINREVSPRLSAEHSAIPLRVRLMAALPLINIITGLTVAAFTSGGEPGRGLGFDVLVAVGVATTISLELTVLLSKSILRPIADLQRATQAVAEGRYDQALPVTTGDELGDLAASFNQMVKGLRERERIREAFGTYLDKEVAEYILSEGFSEEGVELEVSVLFCDVKDFTSFAAGADAQEVVACLNDLFEIVVPIVARHGGHVDKFVGDGLLAVFGAPENYPNHAERAVRAAVEMAQKANERSREGLRIGVGVNTGPVVAGSIGGAGRLNFSVIGDPVNIAARVESATRKAESDVLITAGTAEHLGPDFEVEECGPIELKGIEEPMVLFAPKVREVAPVSQAGLAGDVRPAAGGRLGARPDGGGDGAPGGLGSSPSRPHTLPDT